MFSRFWRTSEKSSFLLYLPSNLMPVLDLEPNKVGRANAHAFSMYVLVHFFFKKVHSGIHLLYHHYIPAT